MNRLASPLEDTQIVSPLPSDLTFLNEFDSDDALPCDDDAAGVATFAPVHYEPRYAYPLLVWLHGKGGHEAQLRQVMPLVSVRNYVAVAPCGTVAGGLDEGTYSWSQSPSRIEQAHERVFSSIAIARKKFNVHPGRIFIAGYGCGGTMAIRIAWSRPEFFAGVASLGGPLPGGHRPLAGLNQLRKLPLLLSSGRSAKSYRESLVCRDLRLLHAGGLTVALRQYPCGDELRSAMLADLDRWIMDVVCGTGVAVQA